MNYDELKRKYGRKVRQKPRHIESEIQSACVEWFRREYPRYVIFSVPNGGSRNVIEAAHLRKEGALAGVSDLIILADGRVLFVEMKSGKGRQTRLQRAFQERVESQGFTYAVCRSLLEFAAAFVHWLKDNDKATKNKDL